MKQIKLNLPEEITNYLSLLSLNIESRKELLDTFVDKYGINNTNVREYMDEYYIYDAKYKMAQNKITLALNSLSNKIISWNVAFTNSTIELTVTDDFKLTEAVKKLIKSGLFISIEEDVAKQLVSLYNNENFTDNDGIVETKDEESCTTCKSCSTNKCTTSNDNTTKTKKTTTKIKAAKSTTTKAKCVEVIPITEIGTSVVEGK